MVVNFRTNYGKSVLVGSSVLYILFYTPTLTSTTDNFPNEESGYVTGLSITSPATAQMSFSKTLIYICHTQPG